ILLYSYTGVGSLSINTERTPSKESSCVIKFLAMTKSVSKHSDNDFPSPSINCFNVTFNDRGDFVEISLSVSEANGLVPFNSEATISSIESKRKCSSISFWKPLRSPLSVGFETYLSINCFNVFSGGRGCQFVVFNSSTKFERFF